MEDGCAPERIEEHYHMRELQSIRFFVERAYAELLVDTLPWLKLSYYELL